MRARTFLIAVTAAASLVLAATPSGASTTRGKAKGETIRLVAFAASGGQPPNNPTFLVSQLAIVPQFPGSGGFVDFDVPNGPTIPTSGSASASMSGPRTSPEGSTEPSIARTVSPRARRSPALRAAAQQARAAADSAAQQRLYHQALQIMEQLLQTNPAAKPFEDFAKKLKEIDDIATPQNQ